MRLPISYWYTVDGEVTQENCTFRNVETRTARRTEGLECYDFLLVSSYLFLMIMYDLIVIKCFTVKNRS